MQLISELPLSAFGGLLSYAEEQEAESSTSLLWIAHYLISKFKGEEHMSHEDFLGKILGYEDKKSEIKNSTPEEISARFAPYIAADKKKCREGK